jgi:hypothetical protein
MSDTRYELAARAGHPALTDIVCYAGIGLGIALQAFAGHPTSTDVVSRAASFYQQTVSAPPPPVDGAMTGATTILFGADGQIKATAAAIAATSMTFGQSGTLFGTGAAVGSTTITFAQDAIIRATYGMTASSSIVFYTEAAISQLAAGGTGFPWVRYHYLIRNRR